MSIYKEAKCSVIETLKLFSAKWKPCIIGFLIFGDKRYGELLKLIPNISKKMLTEHLKELERDGLIRRVSYPVIPPKVVYSLSKRGETLVPLVREIESWGLTNIEGTNSIKEMVDDAVIQSHVITRNVKKSQGSVASLF